MAISIERVAQDLHRGRPGEGLVTVHLGSQSMQDYPSNLTGIWRAAYDRRLAGKGRLNLAASAG